MNLLSQFFLYNVLPSVVTGLLVLGVVLVGIRILGIRHGSLRACLLTAPLIKSSLVMVGLTLVVSWPRDVFLGVQQAAVPPETALPVFLGVAALALVTRFALRRYGRAVILDDARPADDPRLVRALDQVMTAYQTNDARIDGLCACAPLPARPHLLTTEAALASPVAVTTGAATILFPQALIAELSDDELQGALAHEVAHFRLTRPVYCSSELFRTLAVLNPLSAVTAAYLRREEEKACDDIAVTAVGRPTVYAEMLLKSYRFAQRQAPPVRSSWLAVAQLLGRKPAVSERIERVVQDRAPGARLGWQYVGTVVLWCAISSAFLMS